MRRTPETNRLTNRTGANCATTNLARSTCTTVPPPLAIPRPKISVHRPLGHLNLTRKMSEVKLAPVFNQRKTHHHNAGGPMSRKESFVVGFSLVIVYLFNFV